VRALLALARRAEKRFSAHALPLTIDVDFDGQFSTKLEGFELEISLFDSSVHGLFSSGPRGM
jgi:hypothetical protein